MSLFQPKESTFMKLTRLPVTIRRLALLTFLASTLSLGAFADSFPMPFSYTGKGNASGTFNINTTLAMSMTLTSINCFNGGGTCGGDLGTISISTGPFVSGICGDGCFRADNSTVIVTATSGAVLFKGTFNGDFLVSGNNVSFFGGFTYPANNGGGTGINGAFTFNSQGHIVQAQTSLGGQLVPEPATLSLIGTGLLGIAGLSAKKKLRSFE
jgi:hypothetical protein